MVQLQVESPLSTPGGHDHDGDEDDHDGDDGGDDGDGGDYLSWFDIPGSNNTAAMLLFGVNHLERRKESMDLARNPSIHPLEKNKKIVVLGLTVEQTIV